MGEAEIFVFVSMLAMMPFIKKQSRHCCGRIPRRLKVRLERALYLEPEDLGVCFGSGNHLQTDPEQVAHYL